MTTRQTSTAIPRVDLQTSVIMSQLGFTPICTQILAEFGTRGKRGSIGQVPLSALFNTPDTKRKAKSGANRSTWEFGEIAYLNETEAHEEVVADEEAQEYADYFGGTSQAYETVLAQRGMDIINRNMEIAAMQALHNTTTFTGATNTAGCTVEWDTAATADPIGDVNSALAKIRAKCGLTADTLQISWQAWRDLSKTAQIRGALQYTAMPDGTIPLDSLASALGVKRIVVPGNADVYNSAKEGQTVVLSEIWDKEYAFLAVTAPQGADISTPSVGRMMSWAKMGGLMAVDMYRDETVEANIIRAKQCRQVKVISSTFGFLLSNCHT